MGFLCWLTASALCIAVRGESDPHPGTVSAGDSPGMGGRCGDPSRSAPAALHGRFRSGEVVLLLVGPQNSQFLQDTAGMSGKEGRGVSLEGLGGVGA